ncbi:MAG: DUF3786 domain-containing protein [Nitrospirae bacterium]|nr:DUF3786 domain-containing protein [Nitrospirota bacterium]MBF0533968.1 DUF3786 domain-containing protein [Nitrospirota bacterium]MBF0616127.1 DUF3786 domain-containing protein [Nitrospirota bacterium]
MTPIEIYKELPKTNCGQCAEKTCMALAIVVSKGSKTLDVCPSLPKETVERLSNSIKTVDVTKTILENLRVETEKINLEAAAAAIGAQIVDNGIKIHCMGADYTIEKNGTIETDGQVNVWINILLLIYIKMGSAIKDSSSGNVPVRWVSFDELKSGSMKSNSYRKESEIPLTAMFENDYTRTVNALTLLGAKPYAGQPSDNAWIVYLLPKIPVLILYWRGDGEFPTDVKILFPHDTDSFMDVESVIFLMREMVIALKEL